MKRKQVDKLIEEWISRIQQFDEDHAHDRYMPERINQQSEEQQLNTQYQVQNKSNERQFMGKCFVSQKQYDSYLRKNKNIHEPQYKQKQIDIFNDSSAEQNNQELFNQTEQKIDLKVQVQKKRKQKEKKKAIKKQDGVKNNNQHSCRKTKHRKPLTCKCRLNNKGCSVQCLNRNCLNNRTLLNPNNQNIEITSEESSSLPCLKFDEFNYIEQNKQQQADKQ